MTQFNNNLKLITENKKPFEIVQEVNNEIPSYEEFMKTYENDGKINYDDLSGGEVGEVKGYGPMYCSGSSSSNQFFSIKYKFNHSSKNSASKDYFEQDGNYSNRWELSGILDDIKDEQWKLEEGEIKIVELNYHGDYVRNKEMEEKIKDQLRRDVRNFELWKHGDSRNIEREFIDKIILIQEIVKRNPCGPCERPLQHHYSEK